ncbi:hypothetical protein ACWJJH_12130 [Endozoicomonadaceae bacterium StTr2]
MMYHRVIPKIIFLMVFLCSIVLLHSPAIEANDPISILKLTEYFERNKDSLDQICTYVESAIGDSLCSENRACSEKSQHIYYYGYPYIDDAKDQLAFTFQKVLPTRRSEKQTMLWVSVSPEGTTLYPTTSYENPKKKSRLVFFIRPLNSEEVSVPNGSCFKTVYLGRVVDVPRQRMPLIPQKDTSLDLSFPFLFSTEFSTENEMKWIGDISDSLAPHMQFSTERRLEPNHQQGYLCYCTRSEHTEVCIGIRSDIMSTVPGASPVLSVPTDPSGILKELENSLMRQLSSFGTDIRGRPHIDTFTPQSHSRIPCFNAQSIPCKLVSPDVETIPLAPSVEGGNKGLNAIDIVGTGQFSVVFKLQPQKFPIFKDVVWKRVAGFTLKEAQDFIMLQKLAHQVFREYDVKTENTGHFIVPSAYGRVSVYMAQRLIPRHEFVDFHFERFARCQSPDEDSLLLVTPSEGNSPDRVIPLPSDIRVPSKRRLTITHSQVIVCIFEKLLDLAESNLKDAIFRKQHKMKDAAIDMCGDVKADNISVRFKIIDKSRQFSNETILEADAEIFDTHPNTLKVHGVPIYQSEAYSEDIKNLLGVNAFDFITPSIKNLSDFLKIIKRTLACFCNHSITDARLESLISLVKALVAQKQCENPDLWGSCNIGDLTVQAIRQEHKGANSVWQTHKLRTLALQLAQERIYATPSIVPGTLPPPLSPPFSLIPLSYQQDNWLRSMRACCDQTYWSCFEYAVKQRVIEMAYGPQPFDKVWYPFAELFHELIDIDLRQRKYPLPSARDILNIVIDALIRKVPFNPEIPDSTRPISIPQSSTSSFSPSKQPFNLTSATPGYGSPEVFTPPLGSDPGSNPVRVKRRTPQLVYIDLTKLPDTPSGTTSGTPPTKRCKSRKSSSSVSVTTPTEKWLLNSVDRADLFRLILPGDARLIDQPIPWSRCFGPQTDNIDEEKSHILALINGLMRQCGHDGFSLYTRVHRTQKAQRVGFVGSKSSPQEMLSTVLSTKILREYPGKTWGTLKKHLCSLWKERKGWEILMLPGITVPVIAPCMVQRDESVMEFDYTDLRPLPSSVDAFGSNIVELTRDDLIPLVARLPDTIQHNSFAGHEMILMALYALLGSTDSSLYIFDFTECLPAPHSKLPKVIQLSSRICVTETSTALEITASSVELADLENPHLQLKQILDDRSSCHIARTFISWNSQPYDIWFGVRNPSDIEWLVQKNTKQISTIELECPEECILNKFPAIWSSSEEYDLEAEKNRILTTISSRMRRSGVKVTLNNQLLEPGACREDFCCNMLDILATATTQKSFKDKHGRTWSQVRKCLQQMSEKHPEVVQSCGNKPCTPDNLPWKIVPNIGTEFTLLPFPSSFTPFTPAYSAIAQLSLKRALVHASSLIEGTYSCGTRQQEIDLMILFSLLFEKGRNAGKKKSLYILDFTKVLLTDNSHTEPMPDVYKCSAQHSPLSGTDNRLQVFLENILYRATEESYTSPLSVIKDDPNSYCLARAVIRFPDKRVRDIWFYVQSLEVHEADNFLTAPVPCSSLQGTPVFGFNTRNDCVIQQFTNSSPIQSDSSHMDFEVLTITGTSTITPPSLCELSTASPVRELFNSVYQKLATVESGSDYLGFLHANLLERLETLLFLHQKGDDSVKHNLLAQALIYCSEYQNQPANIGLHRLLQPLIQQYQTRTGCDAPVSRFTSLSKGESFIEKFSLPELASTGAKYLLETGSSGAELAQQFTQSLTLATTPEMRTFEEAIMDDVDIEDPLMAQGCTVNEIITAIGQALKSACQARAPAMLMLCREQQSGRYASHPVLDSNVLGCREEHALCNIIKWANRIAQAMHLTGIPYSIQLELDKDQYKAMLTHCGIMLFKQHNSILNLYTLRLPLSPSGSTYCSYCSPGGSFPFEVSVKELITPVCVHPPVHSEYCIPGTRVTPEIKSLWIPASPSTSSGSRCSPFTIPVSQPPNSGTMTPDLKIKPDHQEYGFKAAYP